MSSYSVSGVYKAGLYCLIERRDNILREAIVCTPLQIKQLR